MFSTLWAAGTGGILGVEIIGDEWSDAESKIPIWTAVAGGGLGLGLSLFLTADDPPTEFQSGLISSAGVWGYALGAELVFGTPISVCETDSWSDTYCDPSPHAARMVPVALSTAAVTAAVLYGRARPDLPVGDLALINSAGAWGMATALAIMAVGRVDSPRRPSDFMAAGTAVGLVGGVAMTPFLTVSRSRMWLINLSGMLGVGLASAIVATAEADDERAWGEPSSPARRRGWPPARCSRWSATAGRRRGRMPGRSP